MKIDYYVELDTQMNTENYQKILIFTLKFIDKDINELFAEKKCTINLLDGILVNNIKNFIRDLNNNRNSYVSINNLLSVDKISLYEDILLFKTETQWGYTKIKLYANDTVVKAFNHILDLVELNSSI
jgi:hypothetical protein